MSIWASASEIKVKNNGVKHDKKARLHKKEEIVITPNYLKTNLKLFYAKHYIIVHISVIIILLILFCEICFLICGVSAVESGRVYNHLENII